MFEIASQLKPSENLASTLSVKIFDVSTTAGLVSAVPRQVIKNIFSLLCD